jgi:hypothetical protein
MIFWTADMIAQDRSPELRAGAVGRAGASDLVPGIARLDSQRRPGGWLRRMSVWAGYRMIGVGHRLARPSLSAGTQTAA